MSIVGAATLSLGMMVSIPANASSSDTYWSSGNSYTRDKDNASSVYVQNVSDYYSWVTVYGRKSGVNTDYEVNYNPATGLPVTKLGLYFSDRWHILSSFRVEPFGTILTHFYSLVNVWVWLAVTYEVARIHNKEVITQKAYGII